MMMEKVAKRLAAVGNETRLEIYRLLVRAGDKGRPVTQLQTCLRIPGSTLSHHLRKLIEVGLVQQERCGTTLICRSDFEIMRETFEMFTRECCADEADCCSVAPADEQTKKYTTNTGSER